jgi:hypothetical protein
MEPKLEISMMGKIGGTRGKPTWMWHLELGSGTKKNEYDVGSRIREGWQEMITILSSIPFIRDEIP